MDLAFALASAPEEAEDGQGNRGDKLQRGQTATDAHIGSACQIDSEEMPTDTNWRTWRSCEQSSC